ncbi:hypothetical protein ACFL0M_11920 [Thermodesulfobacteriota bacterium]
MAIDLEGKAVLPPRLCLIFPYIHLIYRSLPIKSYEDFSGVVLIRSFSAWAIFPIRMCSPLQP